MSHHFKSFLVWRYISLGILIITLNLLGQSAYAVSAYNSGYNHGCNDAKISDFSDQYINQPGKGASFHTAEFMRGYNDGRNACSSGSTNSISDDNHAGTGRSIVGNYADGYERGKEQGKNDYRSGNQHDNSCPIDFLDHVSYCTGYKVGYEAGWGASKLLG
jgi:hypothetical protein